MKKNNTLELLIRAVTEKYTTDPAKPGLVVSYLGSSEYYVSIVRYTDTYAKNKIRVCSVKAHSLDEAIERLADEWSFGAEAFASLINR